MHNLSTLPRLGRLAGAGATALLVALMLAPPGLAMTGATITVTDDSDHINASDGDCSLPEAIIAANTNTASGTDPGECVAGTTALDTIAFNIVNGSPLPKTISPTSSDLPAITAPVIIDGSTQPGFGGDPVLALNGGPGTLANGFVFDIGSAGSKLIGFIVVNFSDDGVQLNGGKVTLQQNWIGTLDGDNPASNSMEGVLVNSSGNHIGLLDATFSERPSNVISGNGDAGIQIRSGSGNFVQGNYIGLNADGLLALGNGSAGIELDNVPSTTSTTIGGMLPGQGNVISGNDQGIYVSAGVKSTKISRNTIGANAPGLLAVPNTFGILDDGGISTKIGGSMPAGSNLIAGNSSDAIHMQGAAGNATVTGNIIGSASDGSSLPNGWGVSVQVNARVAIRGNLIVNSLHQGVYVSGVGLPNISGSVQNCLHGNGYGFYNMGSTFMPFMANWWGAPTGPNTAGSDATLGNVTVSPWLKKPPPSCLGWAPKSFNPKDQSFKTMSTSLTKFSWNTVPTANDYLFTLSLDPALGSPIEDHVSTTGLRYHIEGTTPLDYGTYYWQTKTETADGVSWPSDIQTFYVTIQKSPKPGTTVHAGLVNFAWAAYPISPLPYNFGLYSDSSCSTPVPSYPTPVLVTSRSATLVSGTYYWTVRPNGGPSMPCWKLTVS